jgi:hypothetical protein
MAEKRRIKLALLLTATVEVAVKNGNFTTMERMEMYTSTLRYYAKTLGRSVPIYVVENSNADLTPWIEEFKGSLDLTIFQFRPDNPILYEGFDPSRGKGYNEYLMIKKGLLTIANTPPHQSVTHFLKITGRYSMLNIHSIINEVYRHCRQRETVFMCDVKDTTIYRLFSRILIIGSKLIPKYDIKKSKLYDCFQHRENYGNGWCDSRFFAADIDYYRRNIANIYDEMCDFEFGSIAEHRLCYLSRCHRNDSRFIHRFMTQVRFDGISGMMTSDRLTDSSARQDSLSSRISGMFRQSLRILIPFVWI